jgi:hypothetical protein
MRLAVPLVLIALALALLAGCGSSSDEGGESGTGTPGARAQPPAADAGGPSAPIGASVRSCGIPSSDAEALRATGISCDQARRVAHSWEQRSSCSSPPGASRTSCLTRSYRCLGTRTDRGIVVSCSRKGRSIGFVVREG